MTSAICASRYAMKKGNSLCSFRRHRENATAPSSTGCAAHKTFVIVRNDAIGFSFRTTTKPSYRLWEFRWEKSISRGGWEPKYESNVNGMVNRFGNRIYTLAGILQVADMRNRSQSGGNAGFPLRRDDH